jgi:hypothetical protein
MCGTLPIRLFPAPFHDQEQPSRILYHALFLDQFPAADHPSPLWPSFYPLCAFLFTPEYTLIASDFVDLHVIHLPEADGRCWGCFKRLNVTCTLHSTPRLKAHYPAPLSTPDVALISP